MIEHVCGKTRRGKTSYVVARIINEYMQYFNNQWKNSCAYIKEHNKHSELKLSPPPQRHVVSANFKISRKYPNMESYDCSGYEFGVPNDVFKGTKLLIPYGVYAFDEAGKYFGEEDNHKLPPWVKQAFQWNGHIYLIIFLITQRFVDIAKAIRKITDVFTWIEESEHTFLVNGKKVKSDKFIFGKLIKTVWHGRQFDEDTELETYIDGKSPEAKDLGRPFKYVFYGDIRNFYNPNSYAVNFEDLSKDFDYYGMNDDRPSEWTKREGRNAK